MYLSSSLTTVNSQVILFLLHYPFPSLPLTQDCFEANSRHYTISSVKTSVPLIESGPKKGHVLHLVKSFKFLFIYDNFPCYLFIKETRLFVLKKSPLLEFNRSYYFFPLQCCLICSPIPWIYHKLAVTPRGLIRSDSFFKWPM